MGQPTTLIYPHEQTVLVCPGHTAGGQARLRPAHLYHQSFPTGGALLAKPQKRDTGYLLAFTAKEILTAGRRKAFQAHKGDEYNLRSSVEATLRLVKHAFPVGKLPVHGKFEVTCMIFASATITKVQRIQRHLVAKQNLIMSKKRPLEQGYGQGQLSVSFLLR